MALLIPFMGIGPLSRWRDDSLYRWRSQLLVPAGAGGARRRALPLLGGDFNVWVALAVLLAAWLVARPGAGFSPAQSQQRRSLLRSLRRQTPSYWGMVLAHCGFAAVVVGVVATTPVQHRARPEDGTR
jgi:cytochrome c-type biogenesis protein CcmF